MRLAAISDIHGNAVALRAVLADLDRVGYDRLAVLGDLTVKGPRPAEVLALIRERNPWLIIQGNYDLCFDGHRKPETWRVPAEKAAAKMRAYEWTETRLPEADRTWLCALPQGHTAEFFGQQVEFWHATPRSQFRPVMPWAAQADVDAQRQDPATALVLFGHVHWPFIRPLTGGGMAVNVGSVGMPFDGDPRASYALVDFTPDSLAVQIRRVAFDIEEAAADLQASAHPDWEVLAESLRRARYPGE